jgi:methylphosphotriester-DNA--protein-cysteine methyltransferase
VLGAARDDERAELGTTPLAWLTAERVDLARRLIEQGVPLDLVAHRSGLGTTANLRARLRRRTGLSPSQYRARFARDSASGTEDSPTRKRFLLSLEEPAAAEGGRLF